MRGIIILKKLNQEKLRKSNIVSGIVLIIISLIIFIYIDAAIYALIYVLSIGVIITGVVRIINSLSNDKLGIPESVWKFVTGLIILLLIAIALYDIIIIPNETLELVILLITISMILVAFDRIFEGFSVKEYNIIYRLISIALSLVIILLSLAIFLVPLVHLMIVYILSITLCITGITKIISTLIKSKK